MDFRPPLLAEGFPSNRFTVFRWYPVTLVA